MSINIVLNTSGIADALAVSTAEHAFGTLKGDEAKNFFFSSMNLIRTENLGTRRDYEAVFQSLLNRKQKVVVTICIWKDCRIVKGELEYASNWKTVLVEIVDENDEWKHIIRGLIDWQETVPTLRFGDLRDKNPTQSWLEREACKVHHWWREDGGLRTAVFCPDQMHPHYRVACFGNQVLAKVFIRLTDPDGSLRRSLSFPDACPHCGNEYDAIGECGNECSIYADEPAEQESWL